MAHAHFHRKRRLPRGAAVAADDACACLAPRHLGIAEAALRNWLEGRDEPPQMVFLAAVEIVLLHLERPGASN